MRRGNPEGRVALVTGGNRGIGLAFCGALAGAGFDVVVTARDEGAAQTGAARVTGARAARLDVTDEASVERARQAIGRVDVPVNNAGVLLDEGADLLTLDRGHDPENAGNEPAGGVARHPGVHSRNDRAGLRPHRQRHQRGGAASSK